MFLQDQRTDGLSDAQSIARNLIENIVNEVVRSISVQTDNFIKSIEQLEHEMCANEEISDCFVFKNDGIEKYKGVNTGETVGRSPDASDMYDQNMANLIELCNSTSSSSISSEHGEEDDYLASKIQETAAFYHLGLDANQSCLRTQQVKNISNSSLNTDSSHDELIENLNRCINNLSFDNIHLSESDTEDGINERVLKPYLHVPETSSIESQYLLPKTKESDNFINSLNMLQNSNEIYQSNNTHFISTNPLNYNTVEINNYETCKFEPKTIENEFVTFLEGTDELIIVEHEAESSNSEKYYFETNPFKNSVLCTCDPLVSTIPSNCSLDPPMELKNPEKESTKINVFADIEPFNNVRNWEEVHEKQVNITDLEVASKSEDIEEDFIAKNRKYWSSVGLISEDKINPRYVGPTDSLGIESIKGMTAVKENFLDIGNEKHYLVNKSLQSGDKDKVNSLLFIGKTHERKKKKFLSRFRKTISNLFKRNKQK